ncbi:MAG: tRNA(Ile)-lysidine synthase [Gemmatimonadaceae bacterium]|nr:tRNA(Ile)-lysidine synthase [Gemmatimonadaceae bacterium]
MRGCRIVSVLERKVAVTLDGESHVVLAVSGGLDSMSLMHAAAKVRRPRAEVVVATFDHGTGQHAKDALQLVTQTARALGFPVRNGRSTDTIPHNETSWRRARWEFLRSVAAADSARIVTAHTQDDHVETVVMRLLRGAEARGLAALLADSDVARPLLCFTREQLREYASCRLVPWIEDPANSDLRFSRNRVRHEILPALTDANPQLRRQLLRLSVRAARLRRRVEAMAIELAERTSIGGAVTVRAELLDSMSSEQLALMWPALLARCGAVADRRGIVRLTEWTPGARSGGRIQVSGGFEVLRLRDRFMMRRVRTLFPGNRALAPSGVTSVGGWRFYPVELTNIRELELMSNPWLAALDAGSSYAVRAWRPGDRMESDLAVGPRRVARFFEDERIGGPEREGWPVVMTEGGDVVWIPGVRRGRAATVWPGGPLLIYRCEYDVS